MDVQEATKICLVFAEEFNLDFHPDGECGFGRGCVGFMPHGSENYVDYNPHYSNGDYDEIPELQCNNVEPPEGVNAYHKHQCLAVLERGDKAIIQLAMWVNSIRSHGNVRVVPYKTRATGLQAMISGKVGYAILAG